MVTEILEKKLKRERKVVKRLRHQIQITEHAQSRSEQQQSRDRMEVKMDDEEAPKLNRMRHGECWSPNLTRLVSIVPDTRV